MGSLEKLYLATYERKKPKENRGFFSNAEPRKPPSVPNRLPIFEDPEVRYYAMQLNRRDRLAGPQDSSQKAGSSSSLRSLFSQLRLSSSSTCSSVRSSEPSKPQGQPWLVDLEAHQSMCELVYQSLKDCKGLVTSAKRNAKEPALELLKRKITASQGAARKLSYLNPINVPDIFEKYKTLYKALSTIGKESSRLGINLLHANYLPRALDACRHLQAYEKLKPNEREARSSSSSIDSCSSRSDDSLSSDITHHSGFRP